MDLGRLASVSEVAGEPDHAYALSKLVRYVLDPVTSEAGARRLRTGHVKNKQTNS
jgi:hypothetical protein